MLHQERSFQITSVSPPSAFCTRCRQKFTAKPSPGEPVEDVIRRMKAEFEAHQCERLPSQK
jgi:hypothetical protein